MPSCPCGRATLGKRISCGDVCTQRRAEQKRIAHLKAMREYRNRLRSLEATSSLSPARAKISHDILASLGRSSA